MYNLPVNVSPSCTLISLPTCPHCSSDKRQIKVGRTAFGSQRFRCVACNKDYAPHPKQKGYPETVRNEAVRLYVEGISFRRIARVLGVNHQSVGNWITAYQANRQSDGQSTLPEGAVSACETVEMDELYTFVGCRRGEKNTGSTS